MTQSDGRAVHELTRRFVDALDGVAQGMDEKKKARIIQAFDDNAFQINSDPAQLDRFLTISGLTVSQAQFIKMYMQGLDGGNFSGLPGNNTPQAMTWDPRTGQMVPAPIFMMNSGAAPAANPPIYYMPPPQNNDSDVSRKLDILIEKLAEKAAPPPPPQPSAPIRRYQRPVKNEDGDYMMAWVEEPVDPMGSTLTQLSTLGLIGRQEPAPAPASPEAIGEAVAVKLEKLIPDNSRESDAIQGLRQDFQEYRHTVELKDAERNAQEQALAAYETKMKPILDELQAQLRDTHSRAGFKRPPSGAPPPRGRILQSGGCVEHGPGRP